ncbi:MAG: NADH-quinone oxidoreductase subunit C [Bacteroidales bacterium]|jgi:Ni,Fe-hydrogenase III large subunit/Ni,Fe-hydrogenase III component G|nr:NADH-quinone oxidoreductase subunit C [Bacteroidales bacterium]
MKEGIQMNFKEIYNDSLPVATEDIPVSGYPVFHETITSLFVKKSVHVVTYHAVKRAGQLHFICAVADDDTGKILLLSHITDGHDVNLKSLTPCIPAFHVFERELFEKHGVTFEGHPWMKPVRYPHYRHDMKSAPENYPFYSIESEELHEVGVGPVHAGVIEPGHFRFICNGEKVLHLEIQLGYQHRGIEKMLSEETNGLRRCILSESIAGDTSVGHELAHVQLIENLAGIEVNESLGVERCIALEMERLAVHIGDTAALCGDVAYQLGQVVCEALRTTVINTTQSWCGNRFGKGLVRPGGTNYPLSAGKAEEIRRNITDVGNRFAEMTGRIYTLPTILARLEDVGILTCDQALMTGVVGQAARSCGIPRDIRSTHPFQYFRKYSVEPVIQLKGDLLARGMQRATEAARSVSMITGLLDIWESIRKDQPRPVYNYSLRPSAFGLSLIEGWRGEISHCVVTDDKGSIINYKVKDPSFHNWMALALAVRDQEISDFPVCNKSFNLSYCGNDL